MGNRGLRACECGPALSVSIAAAEVVLQSRILGPRHFLKNSLHDTGADAQRLTDLENPVSFRPQFNDAPLYRRLNSASTKFHPFCPRASQTCIYPFPNNPSLELSKYSEHLKHSFARGR